MREAGFYWIKQKGERQWIVCEWYVSGSYAIWLIPGDEQARQDSDFEEIDERRIERS